MSRFGGGRRARRTGWRGTGRRGAWPRGSSGSPLVTALAPDADSRLADGVVVETRLLARLLGIRLLRVEGVVTLAPARLEPAPYVVRRAPRPLSRRAPRRTVSGPVRPVRQAIDAPGSGLARAADLLDDCDRRAGR
jgi:hypothetical protein